jgi:5-methylcytosine-specific restriction endonuclease McrA
MKKRGRPPKYIGVNKEITKLYNSKRGLKNISFEVFKKWYESQNGCCCYCGLTSTESIQLFHKYPLATRGGRRGKSLELDRKKSNIKNYGEDINNLTLACYWCNNAKTNYFSYEEFKIIGEAISLVQKQKLKK